MKIIKSILKLIPLIILISLTFPFPSFSYTINERRGIWYHVIYSNFPQNYTEARLKLWDDFRFYAKYNITEIYFLAFQDYAFYNSSIAPIHPNFTWDVLQTACEIANTFNLSIHAWIVVFRDFYLWNNP